MSRTRLNTSFMQVTRTIRERCENRNLLKRTFPTVFHKKQLPVAGRLSGTAIRQRRVNGS